VLIMRKIYPDAERPFRSPWVPFVPVIGVLACLMLMFSLPWDNWVRLFGWMAIGLFIYFFYGRKHSVMALELQKELAQHGAGGAYVSGTKEH
jgi:APA family basic amino acid/polyamine antiporter